MKVKRPEILKVLKISFFVALCLQLSMAFALAAWPTGASAATSSLQYEPQIQIPNSVFSTTSVTVTGDMLAQYIQAFYNYGMAVVGILAAIVLMAGGILWLTSSGDAGKVGQAKELIIGSIVGTGILFSSWIILNTVNPELLKLKTINTIELKEASFTSCCQYTALLGKEGVNKEDCEKANGIYKDKARLALIPAAYSEIHQDQQYCFDTGCCWCEIGDSFSTLWLSNSQCFDVNSGLGKMLPDVCELGCKTKANAVGATMLITPSHKSTYSWGQLCGSGGKCVWPTQQ